MSKLSLLLLAAFGLLAFQACDDVEEIVEEVQPGKGVRGAYILNQGNSYSGLDGTLSFLDFETYGMTHNVFSAANRQSLGEGPQDGVVYGSKLYVSMNGSQLVWVIDPSTRKVVKQIPTAYPQGIKAAGGAVYVANNDGFVSKIDTASLTVVGKVAVGPNPVDMEVRGQYLYTSVSDGYNYNNGYVNGLKVAKVDLRSFAKVSDITVGLNPGKMTQDGNGNLFVVCNGNYSSVAPAIWRIDARDHAATYCPGNIAAAHGDQLFVLTTQTDWLAKTVTVTPAVWNTKHHEEQKDHAWLKASMPVDPVALAVQPSTGQIYATSRSRVSDYTAPGTLTVYERTGTFRNTFATGIEPYAVVFF